MEKNNSLLIVDDDVSNLIELTQILQAEYKIYTAKNGITALERAEKALPDLILLDIIMPDMNGFEVLSKLNSNEITQNIPVIFITGISESDNESEGLSVGAVDYIRKPFDARVVSLRVRHQIQIVNLRRDLEYAAKSAEMASRTKSVFLANMSHEIRTPMNAILGVTEILIQYDTLPVEIEEGLGKIYSSCDLLLGIINDILDFSKIEAGKLDIMPYQYKIASMINDSVHLNMMRINSKPIDFELQINENIPAKLFGDELRIKQILNNMLSNAFKYTEAGKVTLIVDFDTAADECINLVLNVKDTGCGMTKEQLCKMFEEYSRFNREKNVTIEGTGLGMAITQRLVNLMDGNISVESEPKKGSTFTVRLPQAVVGGEVLGKDVAASLQQFRISYMMHRKREHVARDPMPYGNVLIVDDVESNIYVAEGLLRLYRLQIDTVMRGREAIDKVKNGKEYDIIFMDHMMPEMDGMEAVKQIREMGYKAPIVALTANAVAGQADLFINNGFDDFISKPIDIRQLNTILNKFVRDKQPPEVIEAARKQNHGMGEGSGARSDSSLDSAHDSVFKAVQHQVDSLLISSFLRDANKSIALLEELSSQKGGLEEPETLKKFIVNIHGVKSSLWNINETELAEFASKLETYGRSENIKPIMETTPDFIKQLRALLVRLEAKKEEDKKNEGFLDEDLNSLREKLKEIQHMCADYNRKGALDIIAEIKNCSKETKMVLDNIMEHVLHSEFEKAEEIAGAGEADLFAENNASISGAK